MTTGIYKITSPDGKIYIGQALDIFRRWEYYKGEGLKLHPKLNDSIKIFGHEKHIFEIIHECSTEVLNYWERHYQDIFDVIGPNGLNCKLTATSDKAGVLCEETKLRISIGGLGNLRNEETKIKIRKSHLGKVLSQETKNKISFSRKEKNIQPWNKGVPRTDEVKAKLKLSRTGKLTGSDHPTARIILNVETGVFFDTMKEAAFCSNLKYSTLNAYLKNIIPNRTSLIYA